MRKCIIVIVSLVLLASCGEKQPSGQSKQKNETKKSVTVPKFNADSAYQFVAMQTQFGPRVPETPAHAACADWLTAKLTAFADTVFVQEFRTRLYNGNGIDGKNIVGVFHPEAKKRIVLCAHWDSRPYADHDPDAANSRKPIDGANDGASGVGVLLQLARQLHEAGTTLGVDIVLVDAEDMGETDNEESWGLGTQYWAQHPHVAGYKPLFGILLDMVGASDATFSREYYSVQYASGFVDLVWKCAAGGHFRNVQGGAVTDDHVFVNQAGIPCVDIIDMRTDGDSGFCPVWHTVNDTMDGINAATLAEVGQTLLNVIAELEK